MQCARRLTHSARGKLVYTVHVLTCTCTFTFRRTKAEIFEYDDVIHHMLQALRMLYSRDVTSSTHALTRGKDVIEFPSFQRFHVDGCKTIQIRSVWTRFF